MDFFLNKLKKNGQLSIPFLLGICAFIFVTGGKILWPSHINWLFGDSADALYGWQLFRNTPIFQNPLGANYPYGMGMGGSIINSEQLFIFAFPFKLISRWLPLQFQYTGFWVLFCFICQAIFSWKLLGKITNNCLIKLLGSVFFVLAPPFLIRYPGALSFLGQWLILAGIWLYLSLNFRRYAWPVLLAISSMIHGYFLIMLLAIWLADLLKRKIFGELTYQEIIKNFLVTVLILLAVMWQVGYFMLHSGYAGPGLGVYRMNLLSFIDPYSQGWSHVMRVQPHTIGDYEGFSYLGFGIIILGILSLAGLLKIIENRQVKIHYANLRKFFPLFGIAFLLMIFALSNCITLGNHELFQYRLPAIIGMFRATGRMALPMYYLIYLGIFYLIVRCYKKITAIILIFICLAIQITDLSNVFSSNWYWIKNLQSYNSPLKSPIWIQAAKKYKKVIYFLPESFPSEWKTLANYAAFNNLYINVGYFARVDFKKLDKNKIILLNNILHGQLDKKAFYLIKDIKLRQVIVNTKIKLPYKTIKADDYFLLLPNWYENSSEKERREWANENNYHSYTLGTSIFFQKPEDNFNYYAILVKGWGAPEGIGTWTNGDSSIMLLRLNKKPDSDLILTIKGFPYVNVNHPRLKVEILANQQTLGHITYNIQHLSTIEKIRIPRLLIKDNNLLKIEFVFKNASSPKKLKLSNDERKLGILISSLTLDYK